MSDPVARQPSATTLRRGARNGVSKTDQALALCLQAAGAIGDAGSCAQALDALETRLPLLDPLDIEALISHPDYVANRAPLLRACAETWFERECGLARRALEGPASRTLHRLFGDHIARAAYADELAVLAALRPGNILIIGSGACPMSAIVIQDAFPDAVVVGMDRSALACELATRVLTACGYGKIRTVQGDAAGPVDIKGFDCVVLALTVGVDEADKRLIIHTLQRAADPDAMLIARTAAGWGRVLYPRIDLPEIASRADTRRECSPQQRSVAVPIRMSELPD